MESVIVVSLIAFFATLLATPKLMAFLRGCGIVGIDQQKKGRPILPSSGGLAVALGLLGGIMAYITLSTFVLQNVIELNLMLAASSTILIVALVGMLDDLNIKSSKRKDSSGTEEYRVGLPQWLKPLMTLPAAIPLMAVSAGESMITPPFLGALELGMLYPLLLVPIGVLCVSNATNMLAGMNGLEAGLGFMASLSVGAYALILGRVEGAIIALSLAAALLAFLRFNWYPAKILPGDSLTYLIGATFVAAIIIANIEMFAIIVFVPWIAEAFLKLRGKFAVASLGDLQPDGTLKSKYRKVYSLTHLVMKLGRFRERQVTLIILGLEAIFIILAFAVYWYNVF
jgi:UDP-N-acetylglucosamine--dolichyl-phosphate N-acetylglucosaminephosphotransferase